jgi:pyruvate-formate lyase-activating enzyme
MPSHVACHYRELFIRHTGEVFPCCMVWNRSPLRIGHVGDADILEKIERFIAPPCQCDKAVLRGAANGEKISIDFLNIEFSLACNATCAMCCVAAPDWHGDYDHYDNIRKLIDRLSESEPIREIYVQGGEVLIQKRAFDFLEGVKRSYPSTRFSIVTNGNAPENMQTRALDFFDHFTVSLYAFQAETYLRTSEIDMERTVTFCERISRDEKKSLFLKFLSTPINVHEVNLYLSWAMALAPRNIQVVNSGIESYVQSTGDDFWKKIFHRTGAEVKKSLISADLRRMRERRTTVSFDQFHSTVFHITSDFIEEFGLSGIVDSYLSKGQRPADEWTFPPDSKEMRKAKLELARIRDSRSI